MNLERQERAGRRSDKEEQATSSSSSRSPHSRRIDIKYVRFHPPAVVACVSTTVSLAAQGMCNPIKMLIISLLKGPIRLVGQCKRI